MIKISAIKTPSIHKIARPTLQTILCSSINKKACIVIQRDLNDGSQQFHKFLVAQINLLAAMCRGNNTGIIASLQSDGNIFGVKIDFELVMSAIIDHKLRKSYPNLTAALIELLKGEFIDLIQQSAMTIMYFLSNVY